MLVVELEALGEGVAGLSGALNRLKTEDGRVVSRADVDHRLLRRAVLASLSILMDDEVRCSDTISIRDRS